MDMAENASRPAAKTGRSADGAAPDGWRLAARSRDLKPGRMESRDDLGEPLVIGRTRAGQAYALRDLCPHRAARLSGGKVRREADGRETLECPYHGWRFHTDGTCAGIPSLAADTPFDVSRVRVRAFPVVEAQGRVWIWMSADPRFETAPPSPPPELPDAEARFAWPDPFRVFRRRRP